MSALETWMGRLAKGLHDLPRDAQNAILAEVRAHIADRMSQGLTAEQALGGFGDARDFASRFRDDVILDEALAERHATQALIDLLTTAARSFSAAFGLVTSSLCLLLAVRIIALFGEKLGLLMPLPLLLEPFEGWPEALPDLLPNLLPGLGPCLWPAGLALVATLWFLARTSLKMALASLRMERFA